MVLTLTALGTLAAAGVGVAQPRSYVAESAVYLGQPTNADGIPIAALNTDPRAAMRIGTAQSTLAQVARQIGRGETTSLLVAGVSVSTPPLVAKAAVAPTNVVIVKMRDSEPGRAVAVANAIATLFVDRLGAYDRAKIALLSSQMASDDKRLAQLTMRRDLAQAALKAIGAGPGMTVSKAMASAPDLDTAQSASTETQNLLDDRDSAARTLLVARGVEAPVVISQAAPPLASQPRPLETDTAHGLLVSLALIAVSEWRRLRGFTHL